MPYIVNDFDEYPHRFRNLADALGFAYRNLTAYMRKWTREELATRVIWYENGRSTDSYAGRIRYRGELITYYRNKNGKVLKLNANGTTSPITDRQWTIIQKVENDPKNW